MSQGGGHGLGRTVSWMMAGLLQTELDALGGCEQRSDMVGLWDFVVLG